MSQRKEERAEERASAARLAAVHPAPAAAAASQLDFLSLEGHMPWQQATILRQRGDAEVLFRRSMR